MEFRATQKYLLASPRKLRDVVVYIKKLSPSKAVEILPFIGKRAAEPLAKVIKSAIANAKATGVNESDLVFKEIQIGEGPRLSRWQAGAHGRVKPFKKRMSHIRVVLGVLEKMPVQSPKPLADTKDKNADKTKKESLAKIEKKDEKGGKA